MNFSKKDYYTLLSAFSGKPISKASTKAEIESAYDACIMNPALERFDNYRQMLDDAKTVLVDPTNKTAYDEYCTQKPDEIKDALREIKIKVPTVLDTCKRECQSIIDLNKCNPGSKMSPGNLARFETNKTELGNNGLFIFILSFIL